MKRSGVWGIFTGFLGAAIFHRKEQSLNIDPQTARKGKSKGGGKGTGMILKSGRPLPTGTPVGNNPGLLQTNPFAGIDNWHSKNRAGHRGPRGTGHARRKCWR
jgi:hypothetical protein